jgi:hypothetical protein
VGPWIVNTRVLHGSWTSYINGLSAHSDLFVNREPRHRGGALSSSEETNSWPTSHFTAYGIPISAACS